MASCALSVWAQGVQRERGGNRHSSPICHLSPGCCRLPLWVRHRNPPCTLSSTLKAQGPSRPKPLLTLPLPQKKTLCSSPLCTKMYFCDIPQYRHFPRPLVVKQCDVSSAWGLAQATRAWKGGAAVAHLPSWGNTGHLWPRAERERLQEKKARCLAPGLQVRPVLPGDRNARRIQKQAQGRRKEPGPRGCLQSQPCSRSLSSLLTHLCPRRSNSEGEQAIPRYIWASYFSETQPRAFQGKGRRQGGRGCPAGCAKCWSRGICLLPLERLAWGASACDR